MGWVARQTGTVKQWTITVALRAIFAKWLHKEDKKSSEIASLHVPLLRSLCQDSRGLPNPTCWRCTENLSLRDSQLPSEPFSQGGFTRKRWAQKLRVCMYHYCGQCGKRFTKPYLLKMRIKSVHENIQYPCPECPPVFADYHSETVWEGPHWREALGVFLYSAAIVFLNV